MKRVKALLFDLGGVIVNLDYHKTINAFEALGVTNAEILYNQFSQTEIFDDFETGCLSGKEFINLMKHQISTHSSESEIKKAWNAMILGFEEATLEQIKRYSEKIPCYLLSNTNEIHLAYIQSLLGKMPFKNLELLFNKCYYSHIIGKRKPHKETFEWVLNDMGYTPEDVLFIEDSPQHIEGAKTINLNTLYFTKERNLEEIESWL
ncbi:MAG: HAD-IA family hydrolase [Crocinitomicaceae bacterium]|nr:HAD-IA family hydrolase [Crocinitomicaceae bacterium]